MKPILEVHNLSKQYRIKHLPGGYLNLREQILNFVTLKSKPVSEDFWAVNNVSFDALPGDSIGIIGRNGAGKSTLLKILSRITPPTKGRIISRGTIASLLEVGTGFHPELTGRENVFFNGSLLGMRRYEIQRKFDEIIDFSGVEKFLDTPLKHYSSGMQLRLAFAVAAHLDPEILIIDEVLAVGDATFQRKCFQKMENVNREGRTILFVSHNMSQVHALCRSGIVLESGRTVFQGNIDAAISAYLANNHHDHVIDVSSLPRVGMNTAEIRITDLRIVNLVNNKPIVEGDLIEFEIGFEVREATQELILGISFTDFYGNNILECRSTGFSEKIMSKGKYAALVKFAPALHANTYNLNLGARSAKGHVEYVPSVANIEIIPGKDPFEEWNRPSAGLLRVHSEWEFNETRN